MHILSLFFSWLVPSVFARNVEDLGSGSPGIDVMWSEIMSVFPHTNIGANGLIFVILRIVQFILLSIGGLAVVMLIYAGIKIITGGENGLGEGKKIAMYAIGGIIAAMCADAIVVYAQVLILDAGS